MNITINRRIEIERKKLHKLIERKGINHKDTIEQSKKLDEWLDEAIVWSN